MSVDGQRCDLAFLPLLQQTYEFIGGNRPTAGQHFRVDRQSGPGSAARPSPRSAFRRAFAISPQAAQLSLTL